MALTSIPIPSRPRAQPCVLVCFAVRQEATYFKPPPTQRDEQYRVLITGMGPHNAARVTLQAIERESPQLVLTCGFAGGLSPDLPVGTIVFSADAECALEPLLLQLGATPVQFHCADRIAWSAVEKALLRSTTGAEAVEMESGVIRRVAKEQRVASATIRVISDAAEEDLPLNFNELLKENYELDYRKLTWSLAKAPARIPGLIRLQRQTQLAARRLGDLLTRLLLCRSANH